MSTITAVQLAQLQSKVSALANLEAGLEQLTAAAEAADTARLAAVDASAAANRAEADQEGQVSVAVDDLRDFIDNLDAPPAPAPVTTVTPAPSAGDTSST